MVLPILLHYKSYSGALTLFLGQKFRAFIGATWGFLPVDLFLDLLDILILWLVARGSLVLESVPLP